MSWSSSVKTMQHGILDTAGVAIRCQMRCQQQVDCLSMYSAQVRQYEVAAARLMAGKLQQDRVCSSCVLLQACADGLRFLDERKAGMVALLDRTVRDATLQLKVASLPDRTPTLACY